MKLYVVILMPDSDSWELVGVWASLEDAVAGAKAAAHEESFVSYWIGVYEVWEGGRHKNLVHAEACSRTSMRNSREKG